MPSRTDESRVGGIYGFKECTSRPEGIVAISSPIGGMGCVLICRFHQPLLLPEDEGGIQYH
jgi:hypothetical protein